MVKNGGGYLGLQAFWAGRLSWPGGCLGLEAVWTMRLSGTKNSGTGGCLGQEAVWAWRLYGPVPGWSERLAGMA